MSSLISTKSSNAGFTSSKLNSSEMLDTDESIDVSFSHIEELDPSVSDGSVCIYDREVPMEIRNKSSTSDEVGQGVLENIKVKMLMLGPQENPSSIRLELTSEADLFFAFMHQIDDAGYRSIQNSQKLMIEFADYPNVLIRMLNSCIREPHVHLGIFTMTNDASEGHLDFIQNMEYKYVELMTCSFTRCPEDVVQSQITYRYNSVKSKLSIMQARLFEINNLVKNKNPSLLLQLQKPSAESKSSQSIRR